MTTKKYPPYVNAYGKIPELFKEIKKAQVPTKFTYDFLQTSLGLKSSSYRAMVPLLKNLGFLDIGNAPTQLYKDYRDDSLSGKLMAERIKEAYADLFKSNEFAHQLNKKDLNSKLKTILGASDDDKHIPTIAATFIELVKLADFSLVVKGQTVSRTQILDEVTPPRPAVIPGGLGVSYTINLNLPATTEVEVFNAIFRSLRDNLLGDE